MRLPIYLDTARMGRPRPETVAALDCLSKYWATWGLSCEFDEFLHEGCRPGDRFSQYDALKHWMGIEELKEALRSLAGLDASWLTLTSSRSFKLLESSVQRFEQHHQRVLCFESLWPQYRERLLRATDTVVLNDGIACDDAMLVKFTAQIYATALCHGVLLPAVTHFGRRIPYELILREVQERSKIELAVIDGAQELGHLPVRLDGSCPTIYVSCAQKWLKSGIPLGIAFVSEHAVESGWGKAIRRIDDSLLQFTGGNASARCFGETVSISPLITCRTAIVDVDLQQIKKQHLIRMENRRTLLDLSKRWQIIESAGEPTGIVTLRNAALANWDSNQLRKAFLKHGIVLSAYADGMIRLSMPDSNFMVEELECLNHALFACETTHRANAHSRAATDSYD